MFFARLADSAAVFKLIDIDFHLLVRVALCGLVKHLKGRPRSAPNPKARLFISPDHTQAFARIRKNADVIIIFVIHEDSLSLAHRLINAMELALI